jgi:hypothetical protein
MVCVMVASRDMALMHLVMVLLDVLYRAMGGYSMSEAQGHE